MVLFVILVLPKNYLADNENYLGHSEVRPLGIATAVTG